MILESLANWTWDHFDASFSLGLRSFITYVETFNSGLVAAKYTDPDGFRLGQFVNAHRTRYKKGELESDRIASLEELPRWTWDPLTDIWNANFHLLKRYIEEFGHPNVPQGFVYCGEKLGQWVSVQRTRHKKNLTTHDIVLIERDKKLEGLPNWTWTPQRGKKPSQ